MLEPVQYRACASPGTRKSMAGMTTVGWAVLVAVIVIAGGIGYWWLDSSATEHNVCAREMQQASALMQAWAKTVTPQNPGGGAAECKAASQAVSAFNSSCAATIGQRLPDAPPCR